MHLDIKEYNLLSVFENVFICGTYVRRNILENNKQIRKESTLEFKLIL